MLSSVGQPIGLMDGISCVGGEFGSQCNFAERCSVRGHCNRCGGGQGGTGGHLHEHSDRKKMERKCNT